MLEIVVAVVVVVVALPDCKGAVVPVMVYSMDSVVNIVFVVVDRTYVQYAFVDNPVMVDIQMMVLGRVLIMVDR